MIKLNSLLILWSLILCSCDRDNSLLYIIDPDGVQVHDVSDIAWHLGDVVNIKGVAGDSSVSLSKEAPYGLTVVLKNLNPGEVFNVSVLKRSKAAEVQLVADGSWGEHYFQTNWNISENNGWQKLELRVRIPEGLNHSIRFYVYSTSSDTVYVDHMRIVREESKENSLLEVYTFYPLLYDVVNDYHIRNFEDLTLDSIVEYSRKEHLDELFFNHSVSRDEFQTTYLAYRKDFEPERIQKILRKMKEETAFLEIAFKEEKSIKASDPTGYIQEMFCTQKDSAKVIITEGGVCDEIRLYKLESKYSTRLINSFKVPNNNTLKISCSGLKKGIYQISLMGKDSQFNIPLVVNDTLINSVVVLAPFSTW